MEWLTILFLTKEALLFIEIRLHVLRLEKKRLKKQK